MSETGDWQLVHERYYKCRHVCSMQWPLHVDLSHDQQHFLSAAQYSGPLGFYSIASKKHADEIL